MFITGQALGGRRVLITGGLGSWLNLAIRLADLGACALSMP